MGEISFMKSEIIMFIPKETTSVSEKLKKSKNESSGLQSTNASCPYATFISETLICYLVVVHHLLLHLSKCELTSFKQSNLQFRI